LRPKGEPRLGQHGLYKAFGEKGNDSELQAALMWVLNQADGSTDIDTIANRSGLQLQLLRDAIRILSEHELVALSTD